MARPSPAGLFAAQPSPTNATGQLSKVSRKFFSSKSTEAKLQHLNIDGGVWVILSGNESDNF